MKKSLFAIAAVTAFAGAAQAQSSVTVYGILDVGFAGISERDQVGSVTTKQNNAQFSQSAMSSSRLGFRGTEDLGSGRSAFFTVEVSLSPQDSAAMTATSNGGTANATFNRQSFVGLAQKGIGRASIGTQYTTIHNAIGRTDPGQFNNVAGSVINPQVTGLNPGNQSSNSDGNNAAYTVRSSNMLALQSERLAGFTLNAFYNANNQDTTQRFPQGNTSAGGTTNANGYGLGIDYNWKKLLLTANYQSFKNETTSSPTTASVNSSTGQFVATNATDNQMYFAGMYDFGVLKAYVNYIDRKVTSDLNSNSYVKRSAQQIGVRGNFTKVVEGWASVGTGRFTAAGSNSPTANFNGWQLGSSYILSKRTNLYAIYGQEQTSNTNIAGSRASYGLSNYAVGVRHTF